MNTIFTTSFGRSSTFIWLSISLSCSNKADEVFTAFSKARDFFDRMRGGTSLNGVLSIGERTRSDFDFPHGGLALSGVSRFLLLVFTGVDFVAVAFLTKWYNWPKFRILRPHGLQTRSENLELPCTKENPTWRTISLKTTPKHSFRFEGLKTFSDEEWLCLVRFPNWILKETLKAYSCHSHSYRTSRTICSRIWRLGSTCVCFLPEVVVKDLKINSFLLVTFLFPEMQWSATNQGAYGILTVSSSRRLFSLPPPPPPTVHSNCKSKMAGRTNDPELLTLTLARTNKTPALQAIKIIAFYVVFRGKDYQWILYLTLSDGSVVCTRLFLFRRLFRWIIACRGKAVHHFSA